MLTAPVEEAGLGPCLQEHGSFSKHWVLSVFHIRPSFKMNQTHVLTVQWGGRHSFRPARWYIGGGGVDIGCPRSPGEAAFGSVGKSMKFWRRRQWDLGMVFLAASWLRVLALLGAWKEPRSC